MLEFRLAIGCSVGLSSLAATIGEGAIVGEEDLGGVVRESGLVRAGEEVKLAVVDVVVTEEEGSEGSLTGILTVTPSSRALVAIVGIGVSSAWFVVLA